MITTMDEYRKAPRSLTLREMEEIQNQMIADIGTDADALEIYEDILESAVRYLDVRSGWLQLSNEEKAEQDPGRTAFHDSVIVRLNMLARYLRRQGKSAEWRDTLGDEADDPNNRKRIGDFACYLAFVNSLNAR